MAGLRRDRRLTGLSSDHHHALVLAIGAERAADADDAAVRSAWDVVRRAFRSELEPHFVVEEQILLPALRRTGEVEAADRTLREHEALRALLSQSGDARGLLRAFGTLLEAHVRFEERDLFERAQRVLDAATLDEIGAARPRVFQSRPKKEQANHPPPVDLRVARSA